MATYARQRRMGDPAYQGFLLLWAGFVLAPILFGLDKFSNLMVDWPAYLAPWMNDLMPGTAQQFMYVVGGVEILAGALVAFTPRWGSLVVAGWLGAIIVNLLTFNPPQYYDIALRDFGLVLGAMTLNRLATARGIDTIAQELGADRERPRIAA